MVADAPRRYITERQIDREDQERFIRNVRALGLRAVYGGEHEPFVAAEAGRQLVHLAERRMRQVGGSFERGGSR